MVQAGLYSSWYERNWIIAQKNYGKWLIYDLRSQVECLNNYGWRFITLYRGIDQNYSQEKEMQKGKMVI